MVYYLCSTKKEGDSSGPETKHRSFLPTPRSKEVQIKKALSFLLTITMILTMTSVAFAAAPEEVIVVTNEFEAVLMLETMSNRELRARGYNSSEINTIRNAIPIFDDHIEFLGTLSDENLLASGYNASQIQGIRTYNPDNASNSTRVALSAECRTTSTIDQYTGTSGRVTSKFVWVGIPAFKMTDILVTIWNNWEPKGRSANIKYTHIYGTESSFWQTPTYQDPDGNMTSYGGGFAYPASLQDNYFYASEGFSIFVLERKTAQHLETTARVSHAEVICIPSFSISGMDLGFTLGRVSLGTGHDLAS